MFWIVILLSVIAYTSSKEKYRSNQESVLQGVSFQSINSSSIGIPLFLLKMNLQKPFAMCYPNSSNEQTVKLSLAICKQLGYDALQSYFPAGVSVLNTIPVGKGLFFRTNCSSYQLEQQFCQWKFIGKEICNEYLGLECAVCNYAVEITDGRKREIQFPAYVSCFTNSKCQWNIINRHPKYKVTVLEFRKEYLEVLHSKSSLDEEYDNSGQIEVKWYNPNNKKWTVLRTTIRELDNMDPIKMETNNITVNYFSKDCQRNATERIRRNIATLKYYTEESSSGIHENSKLIMYILAVIFMLAFIVAVILCICCYYRSKHAPYSRQESPYFMSYIPGLNISYDDEDNANSTVATSQANREEQSTNLLPEVSLNSNNKTHQFHDLLQETNQNISKTKENKYLFSLIQTLFFCIKRKSSNYPSNESALLLTSSELDDSSIQFMFKKFDSLVLSLQLSDSTDSDMTIQTDGNSNFDFCSGQHECIARAEQLQNLVTQLATKYKPKRFQKCDDEEDMFSCKSDDSNRTFYSVYPSRWASRTDSFVSTLSDAQRESTE